MLIVVSLNIDDINVLGKKTKNNKCDNFRKMSMYSYIWKSLNIEQDSMQNGKNQ